MWRPTDSGPIWGRWTWELDCAVEEAPHLVVDGKERWGRDQGLGTAFKVCPCRDQLLPTSFPSFVPPALKRASHLKSIQPMNLWLTSSNQTIPQSLTIWSRIAIARMGCSKEEIWRWANRKQSRNLGLHREEGAKTKSPPPNTLCSFCEVSPGILTLFWQSFIDVVSFCTLFESGQGMREIGIHWML